MTDTYMHTTHVSILVTASYNQQGNQRWQIPRPATFQCLGTYPPFFRDVISLLAQVFIFLIDGATQEIPIKNI